LKGERPAVNLNADGSPIQTDPDIPRAFHKLAECIFACQARIADGRFGVASVSGADPNRGYF